MPYWEKPQLDIIVSDEEVVRYEIDKITAGIRYHEEQIRRLNLYRNKLIKNGIEAVEKYQKELLRNVIKQGKEYLIFMKF